MPRKDKNNNIIDDDKKTFLEGIGKLKERVASNENIEEESKKELLKDIDEVAKIKNKPSDLNSITDIVDSKVALYEQQKLENDKKKKEEEKLNNEKVWIAASVDKLKEKRENIQKDKQEEIKKNNERASKLNDLIEDIIEDEKIIPKDIIQPENIVEEKNDIKDRLMQKVNEEKEAKAKKAATVEIRFDDDIVIHDKEAYEAAGRFIDGVAAFEVINKGIENWINKINAEIDTIEKTAKEKKYSKSYNNDSFKALKKSVTTLKDIITKDDTKPQEIELAFIALNKSAKQYDYDTTDHKNIAGENLYLLADTISKETEVVRNLYHNARSTVNFMSDEKGNSYANHSMKDIKAKAEHLKKDYNIEGSVKKYDFEKLAYVSKAQVELRKKIAKVSPTLEKNYAYFKSINSYIGIKNNPKTSDLARYFVLANYLDKAYNPTNCVSDNDEKLDYVKSLNDKFNTKNVKKEIEYLSKNSLFAAYVKNNGSKAFSEWKKVERKSDELKEHYSKILEQMGGKDYNQLAEFASSLRELAGEDIDDGNKKEIADSICENVGKIMALQIMTDPKSRVVLNGAALDLKDGKDRLKELSESCANYLKSKNYFNFGAGAVNDEKCTAKIIDVLKSSKMKSNMMKEFERFKNGAKVEANVAKKKTVNKAKVKKGDAKVLKPIEQQQVRRPLGPM